MSCDVSFALKGSSGEGLGAVVVVDGGTAGDAAAAARGCSALPDVSTVLRGVCGWVVCACVVTV
jgi:hypothetical protein